MLYVFIWTPEPLPSYFCNGDKIFDLENYIRGYIIKTVCLQAFVPILGNNFYKNVVDNKNVSLQFKAKLELVDF